MSPWRLGIVVAMTIAMLWTAWSVVARTAAQAIAASNPREALAWYDKETAALDDLATDELTGGDVDAGRRRAEAALDANPLDSRALFLLGLAAEKNGDAQRAVALIEMAGARSWRDPDTQAWLFNRAVQRRDYARALPHLDAILRVDPDERFLPILAAFTLTPESFAALVDFLATSPPWRNWYLARVSGRLRDVARLDQLYDALKRSRTPPTTRELQPYFDRLIADGSYRRAHALWLEAEPGASRSSGELLFNANFGEPLDGLPFNWQLIPVKGADIKIVPLDGGSSRALRLQLSGARVNFANVKHLLLLPPGSYSFSGRQRAEELHTTRGLWWRIFCADNPKVTLGHTELLTRRAPWHNFKMSFRVPASGCQAQWLQIELPARIASEQQIEGDVWYDHLGIRAGPDESVTSQVDGAARPAGE